MYLLHSESFLRVCATPAGTFSPFAASSACFDCVSKSLRDLRFLFCALINARRRNRANIQIVLATAFALNGIALWRCSKQRSAVSC
jgi:hypothetical protein